MTSLLAELDYKVDLHRPRSLSLEWSQIESVFQRACWRYKFDFERVAAAVRKAAQRQMHLSAYIDLEHVTPALCRHHWALLEREGKVASGQEEVYKLFGQHGSAKLLMSARDRGQSNLTKPSHTAALETNTTNATNSEVFEFDPSNPDNEPGDFNICTSQTIEDLYNEFQSQIAARILAIGAQSNQALDAHTQQMIADIDSKTDMNPKQEKSVGDGSATEEVDNSAGFFGFDKATSDDSRALFLQRFLQSESEAEEQLREKQRQRQEQMQHSQQQRGTSPSHRSFMSRTRPTPASPKISTSHYTDSNSNITDAELSRMTYEITSRNLRQVLGIARIYDGGDESQEE